MRGLRGEKEGGVRSGPGADRTILLFHIIVLVPLHSLVWYVPSLRYTRGLGWRIHCGVEVTESSTNKQHIIIIRAAPTRIFFETTSQHAAQVALRFRDARMGRQHCIVAAVNLVLHP